MKCEFEAVIEGLSEYINKELLPRMNDVQEFFARVIIGRVMNNANSIKENLMNNGYLKTFGIMDVDGKIDVGELACDLKRELTRQEKITFSIPMFGNITFTPSDIDNIYKKITNEELINYANN